MSKILIQDKEYEEEVLRANGKKAHMSEEEIEQFIKEAKIYTFLVKRGWKGDSISHMWYDIDAYHKIVVYKDVDTNEIKARIIVFNKDFEIARRKDIDFNKVFNASPSGLAEIIKEV